MSNNDQSFGQVRHWFTTNVSLTDNGELTVYPSPQYNISPYIGPAPLPNYLYSRPHRYIFILARPLSSTHPLSISAEDFEKLQEPFAAAFKGAQRGDVQDLKDRWGFDARRLCEEKGLEVEAVTFMRVGGTVRSAGANAVMMGEAVVDKVSGEGVMLGGSLSLLIFCRFWVGEWVDGVVWRDGGGTGKVEGNYVDGGSKVSSEHFLESKCPVGIQNFWMFTSHDSLSGILNQSSYEVILIEQIVMHIILELYFSEYLALRLARDLNIFRCTYCNHVLGVDS